MPCGGTDTGARRAGGVVQRTAHVELDVVVVVVVGTLAVVVLSMLPQTGQVECEARGSAGDRAVP